MGDKTIREAGGPIPRGEAARRRVLRAALELLADEGLSGFTMDAVAQRARASKATVYRRWSSRTELLIDALPLAAPVLVPPDSGDLRADLLELLVELHAALRNPPMARMLAAFVDAAERDPELRSLHADLTNRQREPFRQVLAAARTREEIADAVDLELAIDLLAGPLFFRRFITHHETGVDELAPLVDAVLVMLRSAPV